MYETFEKLPESKKNDILQVCIEEFAINGYENTSTNTIVKRLGISKGVLFLYFRNKRSLYLYLVDHVLESLTSKFLEHFHDQGQEKMFDVFDHFDHMGKYYKDLMQKNTYDFKFILGAMLEAPMELREEIDVRHNRSHERLFKMINTDKFRKDIDPKMVMDLLLIISHHIETIVVKQYKNREGNLIEDIDKYVDMLDKYLSIIKYGVYE
ncbi:AcrR family transcriptional regulator [Anaerosolibacter carboniphilus]|uniref:AcrR family transcriptional regulator n=1 Tax=Anaerosolibacter carboniphilus TaxID=1417629 RepID=A0A841KYM5_9FIRM|nr:TetR/AcrR family transcriptional regulator [Anaerosolibacter carboniphilus]MBB6218581.1 AcrR family transcriptional regulator [Anaerosolibacter carboniphilus]